jgi:predicted  nucleic acid-binding Zn-ribbon protein
MEKTDHLPTVDERLERIEGMLNDLRNDLGAQVERLHDLRDDLETRVQVLYDAIEHDSKCQDSARSRLKCSVETDLDRLRYDIRSLESKVSSLERNSRW